MVLTYDHPRWTEFARAMETRPIECDRSHTYTRAALRAIGADEHASITWLENHGGYCDCEVEFNVVFNGAAAEEDARATNPQPSGR